MKRIKGLEEGRIILDRRTQPLAPKVSAPLSAQLEKMFGTREPVEVVDRIIGAVRSRGDEALQDYTHQIEGVELKSLEVSRDEIEAAYNKVDPQIVSSLLLAKERILRFHQTQKEFLWQGLDLLQGQLLIRPLKRVGIYAPGGRASYPSTVLMTALPARAAGVEEVILCTPPNKEGLVPQATLVAADIAGVSRVFALGGAQAIAAMAFGTQTVPQVDKICGPGNIFVMLAKKSVFGQVGIDGLQGPSEVLILADATANPSFCTWEILAQAEHDPMASAILITDSASLASAVEEELERTLTTLERYPIIRSALEDHGAIVEVDNLGEAIELANYYAPEHLCLFIKDAPSYIEQIKNAGCIFLGDMATVTFGDYISGPSHALPTSGTARFASPLGVYDFAKYSTVVTVNQEDITNLGQHVADLAQAEGLEAHSRAVKLRLGSL